MKLHYFDSLNYCTIVVLKLKAEVLGEDKLVAGLTESLADDSGITSANTASNQPANSVAQTTWK